ncbi:MAG: BNR repeat-containing protein [Tepidisphaeraceae bacterium]
MKKVIAAAAFSLVFTGAVLAQSKPQLMTVGDGYAKTAVNVSIFRQDPITTFGDKQYVSYYNADGHVVVAERTIGQTDWKPTVTPFTGNVKDAHNVISMIADGEGYIHLSWDHHGNELRYARSKAPGSLEFDKLPMSGETEKNVTYPQFFPMADGGLIFFYRDGSSGRGNLAMNRYDVKTKTWTQVFSNLISGEGKRNPYWQTCVDPKGVIHVSWVWRESPDVASNHDMCYAKSADGGKTWTKSDGTLYTLPITAGTAETVSQIPQKHELMNQTSMCTDTDGNPVIATYFRPEGQTKVNYHIIRFDGKTWQTVKTTDRKTTFTLGGAGSKAVPISRPQVIARNKDGKTGVWIIFRDTERGGKVSMAGCDDLTNPKWKTTDLTTFDTKFWEPSYDHVRWQRDGVLNLFVQAANQGDGERVTDTPPQKVQVLEWKPE